MKAFKKHFDYLFEEKYTPLYAVTTANKTTVAITERDIQNLSEENSKVKNINHISFFTIKKIERKANHISIDIDTTKTKKGYYNESNNENETYTFEFETKDAENFIIYLNRALYRILTAEELKSINTDECKEFVTSFPTSSSKLTNDGLIAQNNTTNSEQSKEIQPFYIYARFIEKVLLENSEYFTNSIDTIVDKVSLKNLKKILKYKINKINVFKDFPDCQKYFPVLFNDIIPLLPNVKKLVIDSSSITNTTSNDNNFNYVSSLIQLVEKSKYIKEVTFIGELPSNINDFFTKLCEKRPNSLTTLSFKNSSLNQNQMSILKTSLISCIKFHNSTFDSNDELLDFIQIKKLDLFSIKNSPQIDFLTNMNKFTNISILSLEKCNIEISDFFTFLSQNECKIQCLYLTGNKCEKTVSNDLTIPKFEEIRVDSITWGSNFTSCLQLLLKTQSFIDASNASMSENEWDDAFNYLNTTSDGASQLCKLLWNGNKVSKSFFAHLKKCAGTIDSLQIVDAIDQSTPNEVFDEFTSFLKDANKLVNLFIGFSSQSSRSLKGSQLKSILSSLLANMKTQNSKSFCLSVPNSLCGDEGVEALTSTFGNQKVCRINSVNFDGLHPKSSKKYNQLCESIAKYLSKAGGKKETSIEVEYPRNDLKSLKSQMQEKEYKKLCHEFCFISYPSKLNFFQCDYLYDRMIFTPRLGKKKYVEQGLSMGMIDKVKNDDESTDELVKMIVNESSIVSKNSPEKAAASSTINEASIDDEFTSESNDENKKDKKEQSNTNANNAGSKSEQSIIFDLNDDEFSKNEKTEKNTKKENANSIKGEESTQTEVKDYDNSDENENQSKTKKDDSNKSNAKEKQSFVEFEEEEEENDEKKNILNQSKNSVKVNVSSSLIIKNDKNREEEDYSGNDNEKAKKSKNSPSHSRNSPNRGDYSPHSKSKRISRTRQSFEYDDDKKKRRVHRVKRLSEVEDDYYEFYESDYEEYYYSDSFDSIDKKLDDQKELNFTPNPKRKKLVPQSAVVERSKKIDLLEGVVPKTVQINRNKHRASNDKDENELNSSKRSHHSSSKSRHKRKSTSYETLEDRGSDIEFPEMEEITVKNQSKVWSAIEEKFSLNNIIQAIRAKK